MYLIMLRPFCVRQTTLHDALGLHFLEEEGTHLSRTPRYDHASLQPQQINYAGEKIRVEIKRSNQDAQNISGVLKSSKTIASSDITGGFSTKTCTLL